MRSVNFLDYIEINPKIVLEKNKMYPFIEMANVGCNKRNPDRMEIKKYTSGVKFIKGDTVISRIEPCLQNGKAFFVNDLIDEGFGSTEFIVFRSKESTISNKFLFYFMQQYEIRQLMIKSMSGATGRQRVNLEVFNDLKIKIPAEKEKIAKIADILSKYDDLIENNQKRIELLEEATQRLYKEWFIDLKFPGHEKTKIKNDIPEGWEKKKVKDICDFKNGYAYKTKDWISKGFPVIKIKNIQNNTIKYSKEDFQYISEELSQKTFDFKLKPLDVIIAMTGATVGKMAIIPETKETYYMNQRVGKLISKKIPFINLYAFLFLTIDLGKQNVLNLAYGAAQPNISSNDILNIELMMPEEKILRKFIEIVYSKYKLIISLHYQNQKLAEARDRLLPKLMKGEIEV